ncbi:MAG: two-component sensor histidine kinase, partial [Clostridiales bacterium]
HMVIETINYAENLQRGDYNQIFNRFTRLDKHRSSASGGNGIGLSILKSIVEKYQGRANASSDGTTLRIVVEIPL